MEAESVAAAMRRAPLDSEGKPPTKSGAVKTIAVACDNCGHVQQFVLDVLLKVPEPNAFE